MKDDLTLLFRKVTDVMLVRNPVGTSLGVFVGLIIYGIAEAFDFNALGAYVYVSAGIVAFNIRAYIKGRHIVPSKVEALLVTIDDAFLENKITEVQRRSYYRKVVNEYINESFGDRDIKDDIDRLKMD